MSALTLLSQLPIAEEREPAGDSSHGMLVRVGELGRDHARAVRHGAREIGPPAEYPYGERQYIVLDCGGHRRTFTETVADVAPGDWGGMLLAGDDAGTADTGGAFALLEMWHPPSVGPALHRHPRGAETFLVLDGSYTFFRDTEAVPATAGHSVTVPAGVPHRYQVGPEGGRLLVVCPPGLERYFEEVATRSRSAPMSLAAEFELAAAWGQDFLDQAGHWESDRSRGAG